MNNLLYDLLHARGIKVSEVSEASADIVRERLDIADRVLTDYLENAHTVLDYADVQGCCEPFTRLAFSNRLRLLPEDMQAEVRAMSMLYFKVLALVG